MKAVSCATIARFVTFPKRRAIEWAILLPETPAVAKIIFGAGAAQPGLRLAIDKEEIVPFAIPASGHHLNALNGPNVVAATLNVGQQIIAALDARKFLPIHRMKIRCTFRQRPVPLPIDIFTDYPTLIESRNSMLLPVFFSLFRTSSIASTGGTPVRARRRITTLLYSSGW